MCTTGVYLCKTTSIMNLKLIRRRGSTPFRTWERYNLKIRATKQMPILIAEQEWPGSEIWMS